MTKHMSMYKIEYKQKKCKGCEGKSRYRQTFRERMGGVNSYDVYTESSSGAVKPNGRRMLSRFQRVPTLQGYTMIVVTECRLCLKLGGNTDLIIRPKHPSDV